ncbi:MAG TPA: cytochrome P450 [Acidimicrobiia bacterium]|jgi:cytochrome P450
MDEHIRDRWGAFDQATVDDPYPLYARLRDEAPVTRVTMADGRPGWLVTDYDAARQVLSDARLTKDLERLEAAQPGAVPAGLLHPLLAHHMLASDPPDHTRLRKLVSHAFTPARVEGLRPRVQAITDELLDALDDSPGRPVDLVDGFAFPLPIVVICELLGMPVEDRDRLRSLIAAVFASPMAPANDPQARAAADEIAVYLRGVIDERHRNPGDDLFSGLIAARDGGDRLDEAELLSTAWLLMVAGHETTVNLIGNGTVALLLHPEQLAGLRADPSLVPSAVEEFLRYNPPVHHSTFRMTTEPIDVGGVTIPAHEQVLVVLAAAGRDPARFPGPDELDLTRGERGHLAFGYGIHFCLGAPLARLEGEIAFTSLLARFPRLRLAVPPAELHWHNRLVLRSLRTLPVFLRDEPFRSPGRSLLAEGAGRS